MSLTSTYLHRTQPVAAERCVASRVIRSRIYLPACLIPLAAVALIGVGWFNHWGGASFSNTWLDLRVVVIGPVSLAIVGALMVAERIWPAQQRPPLARGYRQDALYAILNATATLPLVAALSLSFSDVVRTRAPWLTFPRMGLIPHAVMIAVIFVALDACNWAVHLANHRFEALWRFHELHHSQEDMSVLTVFRTHPLVHVSYLAALLPGIVLIANGGLSTALLVVYGGWVALAHSNLRLTFGPLDRLLVSPNYHRIHHRLEGRQDVNLGFALTIWDQLFKTAVFANAETVAIATGLAGRPLIVEQSAARPRHLSVFASQLMAPLRPMTASSNPKCDESAAPNP
jgi:sterol desaturase/sphingolipid hydroxylase (fatty acid hydroxylase superfamily)